MDRRSRGFDGRCMGAISQMFGRNIFRRNLERTPAILAAESITAGGWPLNQRRRVALRTHELRTRYARYAWVGRSGGIGRRSGLKLRSPQGRPGSNPGSGTTSGRAVGGRWTSSASASRAADGSISIVRWHRAGADEGRGHRVTSAAGAPKPRPPCRRMTGCRHLDDADRHPQRGHDHEPEDPGNRHLRVDDRRCGL